jgi:hypothetical protein
MNLNRLRTNATTKSNQKLIPTTTEKCSNLIHSKNERRSSLTIQKVRIQMQKSNFKYSSKQVKQMKQAIVPIWSKRCFTRSNKNQSKVANKKNNQTQIKNSMMSRCKRLLTKNLNSLTKLSRNIIKKTNVSLLWKENTRPSCVRSRLRPES